jgi:hypothetical protein
MPPQPGETVTWIKVEPLTFDLFGVLFSSLSLTGILLGAALLLGVSIGLTLILRRRREGIGIGRLSEASLDLS